MRKFTHFYLVYLKYLGYRYHGWAKQPNIKTIHGMIDKTMDNMLGDEKYKTMGASRTDARVSANQSAFELFLNREIDLGAFKAECNRLMPADILIDRIIPVDHNFNILKSPKLKHYVYLFSFGETGHPFCAPLVATFPRDNFNVELMKQGAELFVGEHNFKKYCKKPMPDAVFQREIIESHITANDLYSANFFPSKTYAYHVKAKGFMRNQVRMMMGQLITLGRGEIGLDDIRLSLQDPEQGAMPWTAPANGLILQESNFELPQSIAPEQQASH